MISMFITTVSVSSALLCFVGRDGLFSLVQGLGIHKSRILPTPYTFFLTPFHFQLSLYDDNSKPRVVRLLSSF
jgi:hypothetical protein